MNPSRWIAEITPSFARQIVFLVSSLATLPKHGHVTNVIASRNRKVSFSVFLTSFLLISGTTFSGTRSFFFHLIHFLRWIVADFLCFRCLSLVLISISVSFWCLHFWCLQEVYIFEHQFIILSKSNIYDIQILR